MRKLLWILSFGWMLIGCHERQSTNFPVPDNLLSKEQMIDVLKDLTILEAGYQVRYIQVSRYSYQLQKDADSIFQSKGFDRESFESSLSYYTKYQEQLKEIYTKVNEELKPLQENFAREAAKQNEGASGDRSEIRIEDFESQNRKIRMDEDIKRHSSNK